MIRPMRSPLAFRIFCFVFIAATLSVLTLWLRMPPDFNSYRPDPSDPPPELHTHGHRPVPDHGRNASIGSPVAHMPILVEFSPSPDGSHPIDRLVRDAQHVFDDWLEKESNTIEAAAAAYRERRGRHPPPGFREWYEFAVARGSVMVEDFFDQVHHDLEPFWALDPAAMRVEAADFEMSIRVQNGVASTSSDWFWTRIWLDMIQSVAHLLPDLDIALNAMDEPRLVVPWEDINAYMTQAHKTRRTPDSREMMSNWTQMKPRDERLQPTEKNWESDEAYWPIARRGCEPESPARKADVLVDFGHRPAIEQKFAAAHKVDGFVSNYTLSSDICHQPDLQGLHGFLIQPLSTAASNVLFPIFGGSKMTINNDILLPASMYWQGDERFTGGKNSDLEWGAKWNAAVWRGVATGGRNGPENWRGFQRHRFVAMNNGTKISRAEQGQEPLANYWLPQDGKLAAQRADGLGDWVDSWAEVGFIDLMCLEDAGCKYVEPHFRLVQGITMDQQFDFKYLPDIDGNSFSGRYLGFLRSTSLPLKSTLFREWHDSRLLAWKHFVPMDTRYEEYYSIMEYFIGYGSQLPGHDAVAQRIAMDGREWAERVLRREDMQVYTLRLLLEYARVSHDDREKLGWVADLAT